MSKRRRLFALCVASLFALGLILTWVFGSVLTRSTNRAVPAFPHPAQVVGITASDQLRLAGSYWPAPEDAPAILLLHGNGGSRVDVARTAAWLNRNGYALLAIDFRGHGESDASSKSFGLFEARDAHAAFAELKSRHPNSKIGVIGFSLGGSAALVGEDGPLQPDALVLEAVFPDIRRAIYNRVSSVAGSIFATAAEPLLSYQSIFRFGVWPNAIAPINAVRRVKAPILIIGGGADKFTPPAESKAMYDAIEGPKEIWFLDGASHDEVIGDQSPEMQAKLISFLDRSLKRK